MQSLLNFICVATCFFLVKLKFANVVKKIKLQRFLKNASLVQRHFFLTFPLFPEFESVSFVRAWYLVSQSKCFPPFCLSVEGITARCWAADTRTKAISFLATIETGVLQKWWFPCNACSLQIWPCMRIDNEMSWNYLSQSTTESDWCQCFSCFLIPDGSLLDIKDQLQANESALGDTNKRDKDLLPWQKRKRKDVKRSSCLWISSLVPDFKIPLFQVILSLVVKKRF